MGEIASIYPTAGGLYYWSSKLGSPGWGWFTGWFNLIGQIAVTAAIGYGCAVFTTALLNLLWDYPNTTSWIFFTYGMILLARRPREHVQGLDHGGAERVLGLVAHDRRALHRRRS